MTDFTPWSALLGGALIGTSASVLLVFNGRIAGISGVLAGLVRPTQGDSSWRAWFVAGLLAGGAVLHALHRESFGASVVPVPLAALAGLLVGFGTRLGNGCTSGHGVCGLSRFSTRSFAAVLTFIATGVIAHFVLRHLMGGAQ